MSVSRMSASPTRAPTAPPWPASTWTSRPAARSLLSATRGPAALATARTMLRDPGVLGVDEATSALDTETERAVQQAFDTLARGRTTITIAHRLSTVRNADQIIVVDHGHIIEAGDHTSLLAG